MAKTAVVTPIIPTTSITPVEVKSGYWDKELLLKEVQAGENIIKVSLCTKKEREWLSIREWYKTITGEYMPGKHGLAIPVEDPKTVDFLAEAISYVNLCRQ